MQDGRVLAIIPVYEVAMPISVEPRESGHVLYYAFIDPWTIADVSSVGVQAQTYLENATGKVHNVVDLRQSKQLPQGILHARHAFAVLFDHRDAGETVIVGASRLARAMGELIAELLHFGRMKFFEQEGEAWTHIRQAIAADNGHDNRRIGNHS